MDAAALAKTKSGLKKRNSIDRSKPMVEDAAHPGSGGIMKAISSGTFALKHVDKAATHDASAPMLEAGTAYHTDIRPAVFAEVHQVRRNSLKPTKTNDRSEPVIEKWVHVDVMHKPARACVIDEIKEKKASIDALHTFNEHHTKAEIEKRTRPALMSEIKSFKEMIVTQAKDSAEHSKVEMEKKVHHGLMDELHKKKSSITAFTELAAAHQSEDNFRSQTHPGLCNEIIQKKASIDALGKRASQKLAAC